LTLNEYPVILLEFYLINILTNTLDCVVAVALLVLTLFGVIPTIVGHNTEFHGGNTRAGD
jgi:hypothetical protein